MEGTSLVSVSQYDGGRRRVMDDGTYDIDIEVGPGRCGMSTLVLFLPHTTRPPQQSLTPGYDYDAAYDDEYPPQQPYPHPGIRGLQVIAPQHQLMRYSLSRAVWRRRTAVRCWWFAQSSTVGI